MALTYIGTPQYGWKDPTTGQTIPAGSPQVIGAIPQWGPQNIQQQVPGVNVSTPGKTTVRYPGTESGKLWYETSKPETAAAKVTEGRALTNQQAQLDAAQQARDRALQSSGYTDYVSQRQNLAPTYDTAYKQRVQNLAPTYDDLTMAKLLTQERDVLEGQTAAQKRGLVEAGGGSMPSGYRREQLNQADINKAGQYGRIATELGERKAKQDRLDEVEKIGLFADIGKVDRGDAIQALDLALKQAQFDYGVESDLAQAIERIKATTIAATPEYNWDNLKDITDRMAATQEYIVETEGGFGGGEGAYSGEGGGEGGITGEGGVSGSPSPKWILVSDQGTPVSNSGGDLYQNTSTGEVKKRNQIPRRDIQNKSKESAIEQYKKNTGRDLVA